MPLRTWASAPTALPSSAVRCCTTTFSTTGTIHRLHGFRHPFTALRNAEADFSLTARERNIIVRHMFPLVPIPPTCREAWIVCLADKYCALRETVEGRLRGRTRTGTDPRGSRA